MTLHTASVAEDGIVLSSHDASNLDFATFEQRVVKFSKEQSPLNLYGSTMLLSTKHLPRAAEAPQGNRADRRRKKATC
jgi:hypothetical protein